MQLFVEALKYLPENINAAKSSTLGVVCLLLSLAFLLCLAFFYREGWRVKAGVLAGFFLCGFVGVLIGNSERTAGIAPPAPPVAVIKPEGKLVDSKGDPVANAKISIDPGGIPSSVLSASDGGFQFSGFRQSANVQQLSVSHQDFENLVMNLRPDDVGTYQRIQLRRRSTGAKTPKGPPSNGTVILSGTVLDGKGQPIADAEVVVEAGGDRPQRLTTYTRSDGGYRIEGFQPQPNTAVLLRVRAKGFDPVSRDIDPSDRRIQEIRLTVTGRSARQLDSIRAAHVQG